MPTDPILPGTRYDPRTDTEEETAAVLPGTYTAKDALPVVPPTQRTDEEEERERDPESRFIAAVEAAGVLTTAPDEIITVQQFEELLNRYGADTEVAAVRLVITTAPAMTFERRLGRADARRSASLVRADAVHGRPHGVGLRFNAGAARRHDAERGRRAAT